MPEPSYGVSYNLTEIKELPILDVCDYLGIAVEKRGKDYWCRVRSEKNPSVILHTENNTFYDFGNTEHGSNIDLVCYATGKSFADAVVDLGIHFQLQPESREDMKKRFSVMSLREYERIGLHGDLATKNFTFPIEHLSPGKLLEIERRYRMSMNELRKAHTKTYERILREKAIPYVEQLRNSYYFEVWRYYDFLQSFGQTHLFYDSEKTYKHFSSHMEVLKRAENALYKACHGTSITISRPVQQDPYRVLTKLQQDKLKISIGSHTQDQLTVSTPDEIVSCFVPHDAFFQNAIQNYLSKTPHAALLSWNGVEVFTSPLTIQQIQSTERHGIDMENPLVIGILNIVEDKLREFNIQIPDEDREGSTDPIVGYQYAELHDRIQEYLEEQGIALDKNQVNQTQSYDPLMAFIEQEVPYRFKNILDQFPEELPDDIISDVVEDLQENTDVMFDYDALDDFLIQRANEYLNKQTIGNKPIGTKGSLDGMIQSAESRRSNSCSSKELQSTISER